MSLSTSSSIILSKSSFSFYKADSPSSIKFFIFFFNSSIFESMLSASIGGLKPIYANFPITAKSILKGFFSFTSFFGFLPFGPFYFAPTTIISSFFSKAMSLPSLSFYSISCLLYSNIKFFCVSTATCSEVRGTNPA